MPFKHALAAFLLVGSFAGAAYAAEPATQPTATEKAELARLSPAVRQQVEARIGHGETVRGVLDTMLLNKVSHDFADGKIVATDFDRGTLIVAGRDGQLHAIPFDIETLSIKQ